MADNGAKNDAQKRDDASQSGDVHPEAESEPVPDGTEAQDHQDKEREEVEDEERDEEEDE